MIGIAALVGAGCAIPRGPRLQNEHDETLISSAREGVLEGEVVEVDRDRSELIVRTADNTVSLAVDEDSDIQLEGRRGSLLELHEGQEVRAVFEVDTDGWVAKQLDVVDDTPKIVVPPEHE